MVSGFFGKVGDSLKGAPSKASRYTLTEDGEDALLRADVRDRRFEMLATAKKLQPSFSAREFGEALKFPKSKAESAIELLLSEGYIAKTS